MCGFSQRANNAAKRLPPTHRIVLQIVLLAKRSDDLASTPQVVARHAGEQMVLHLILEAPKEPFVQCVALQIESRGKLVANERVACARKIGPIHDFHGEVGDTNLDVKDSGDDMGDKNEHDPHGVRGQERDQKAQPRVESKQGKDFDEPVLDVRLGQQEQPALDVEVKARESHEGEKHNVLIGNEEACKGVKG